MFTNATVELHDLCSLQRLMAKLSQIEPQMEQLQRHLQEAAGSLTLEEKAELEGKVKDMQGRLTALKDVAQVQNYLKIPTTLNLDLNFVQCTLDQTMSYLLFNKFFAF